MSRSNPTEGIQNPAVRRFEWKGSKGCFVYYDKDRKENIEVASGFTFILLDRLANVRGYNKKQKMGIYSNEVRDTRSDPFVVKFYNGPVIAEGVWADIKDKVTARSGKFGINCYVAFKLGNELKIGSVQLTGCALGPWIEFEKAHRKRVNSGGKLIQEIYARAIAVKSSERDTSGDVEFEKPVFSLVEISDETNRAAIELDKELQDYLAGYLKRPKVEQVEGRQEDSNDDGSQPEAPEPLEGDDGPPEEDNCPF